jgi:hypothetical protein
MVFDGVLGGTFLRAVFGCFDVLAAAELATLTAALGPSTFDLFWSF